MAFGGLILNDLGVFFLLRQHEEHGYMRSGTAILDCGSVLSLFGGRQAGRREGGQDGDWDRRIHRRR